MTSRMSRASLGALLAVGLAAAVPPLAAHAAPAPESPAGAAPVADGGESDGSFTLVTGDRVAVEHGNVTVVAGAGRRGMRFVRHKDKRHHFVIPVDALGLIRAGVVDRRMFDLAELRADGYDDRSTSTLPLLVSYRDAGVARSRVADAQVARDIPGARLLAVRAEAGDRTELWASLTTGSGKTRKLQTGIARVWLDGKRRVSDDVSNPQIGVPAAWQAGLDGKAVPVAVLDTGIDATHPDLGAQVADAKNFTSDPDTDDTVGHGTHVASIVAGTGAASDGRYRGVAPGARLLIGKVCRLDGCAESDILAGMEWAASRARVVNMSLGGPDTPGTDPLEQAVNDLTARYDALFVIAAGNYGADNSVGSPSSADAAVSVAAVDANDELAPFSSRGPRTGDAAVKPDIAAPGVDIVAAKAANGALGDPAPVDGYVTMSGTSMATPHLAGAAAILTQQHPEWTAAQRKAVLMGSSVPVPGISVTGQGAGRVDVARAITQTVSADGGSVSFGLQRWPHDDDKAVTGTITYRNGGAAPVTLSLALDGSRAGFTLGVTELTVPAGGTAATTLTSDTTVDAPDGVLSGHVLATASGGVRVSTPYAVVKEVESYDVTLRFTGREGEAFADLYGLDVDFWQFGPVADGVTKLRVPRGNYGVIGDIFTGGTTEDLADDTATTLVNPRLLVDRDMTLDVNARRAKPLRIRLPRRDAGEVGTWIMQNWAGKFTAAIIGEFANGTAYLGPIGKPSPEKTYYATISGTFARDAGDKNFTNSPFLYELFLIRRGVPFTGYRHTFRNDEFAKVDARYSSGIQGGSGGRRYMGLVDEGPNWASFSGTVGFDLPFHRTEFVTAAPGLSWASAFGVQSGEDYVEAERPARTYPVGQTTREDWRVDKE